jgi:hypothetical protein
MGVSAGSEARCSRRRRGDHAAREKGPVPGARRSHNPFWRLLMPNVPHLAARSDARTVPLRKLDGPARAL